MELLHSIFSTLPKEMDVERYASLENACSSEDALLEWCLGYSAKNTLSYPPLYGMGEPESGVGRGGGEVVSGRTRKRILDPLEAHEDDSNARRLGVYTDWPETIKGIGVPNKKGNMSMDGAHQRPWESEDIDQGLAADLDDSLSGLGVDISTASYNMSEALLALPSVPQFKEEGNSPNHDKQSVTSSTPTTFDESSQTNTTDRLFKLLSSDSMPDCSPPSLHHILQQHMGSSATHSQGSTTSTLTMAAHHLGGVTVTTGLTGLDNVHESISMSSPNLGYEDNRFQYILGAATSVATKVSEESLSYLNQGQPYEVKVKKLGDLTSCRGKFYHSVIRVCFHERRLQYMERQQLDSWRQMRPGERILELDIPLSYGIFDVKQDSSSLNTCEFDWDPTKEVGFYIKVNCISTEFTPKKHGGEKGVPFRIQIETYTHTSSGMERLYVCACQIKVFKLKGADRKHKQDREKIMKRSPSEQEKYQPSCECTILTELSPDSVYVPMPESSSPVMAATSGVKNLSVQGNSPPIDMKKEASLRDPSKCLENGQHHHQVSYDGEEDSRNMFYGMPLHPGSTTAHTSAWLVSNRFNKYDKMFANFTGTDILRLSRGDLIEMCGIADGLRLFYALHAKKVAPRLTVYVCMEHEQLYHAVYLETQTCQEFTHKLCALLQISFERIHDVYLQGPSGIHILVTDEVVQNMAEESTFSIEVLQDSAGERFRLLIRPFSIRTTSTATSPPPQS